MAAGRSPGRRTTRRRPQGVDIHLQLRDGTRQRIAMKSQLRRGARKIAVMLLQSDSNEGLFEFADSLAIKDAALVHLQDQ